MKPRYLIGALLVLASTAAVAYLPGGHYYSIVDLAARASRLPVTQREADPYWNLVAYCAELPDLSEELDATTQREHVLFSHQLGEMGSWAWTGRCNTPVSKHMATAQYYLHGLTGQNKATVRAAAKQLFLNLDERLHQADLSSTDRTVLACASGLALHLYGDSFAHSMFPNDDNTILYRTGIGHGKYLAAPDYMAQTEHASGDQWRDWIVAASAVLFNSTTPAEGMDGVIPKPASSNDSRDQAELNGDSALVADMGTSSPRAIQNIENAGVERSYLLRMVSTKCDDKMRDSVNTNPWLLPQGVQAPNCQAVWQTYHKAAKKAFAAQNIALGTNAGPTGPDVACDADDDQLVWGLD